MRGADNSQAMTAGSARLGGVRGSAYRDVDNDPGRPAEVSGRWGCITARACGCALCAADVYKNCQSGLGGSETVKEVRFGND